MLYKWALTNWYYFAIAQFLIAYEELNNSSDFVEMYSQFILVYLFYKKVLMTLKHKLVSSLPVLLKFFLKDNK